MTTPGEIRAFTMRASEGSVLSELVFEGRSVGEVPGSTIERQFALNGQGYLVFISYDSPFEESLHAVLLDQSGRILDRVRIGPDGIAGVLGDISWRDGAAHFAFPKGQQWRLRVAARKGLFGSPRGQVRLLLETV